MKIRLLFGFIFLFVGNTLMAQVGPPNNVGREYGNPSMPFMITHLTKANAAMLQRGRPVHHTIFSRTLCFKKICRIKAGHTKSLHAISFDKYKKKVAKNAKKGEYKKVPVDSTGKRKPMASKKSSPVTDTTKMIAAVAAPATVEIKADSLIVLGGELLFATNSSTLMGEHFVTLNSIAEYLARHPNRMVKISGFTDNTGKENHNLTLSKRRADVVAEYLVDNGVSINRVSTEGLGSSKPIATNTTSDGRTKNRRVELLIQDGQ